MAAGAAFGVDPAGVVVRAEVVVAGGGVGDEVPDDGEDGAADRNEGFEFASSFDQAPVAGAEKVSVFAAAAAASPSTAFEVGGCSCRDPGAPRLHPAAG